MKKTTILLALLLLGVTACNKQETGPSTLPGSGDTSGDTLVPTAQDSLIPVPVYFRNLNDIDLESVPYIDSFRLHFRYIFYICPYPGVIPVNDTPGIFVDTVFPARVDAPDRPNAGYLEYHAATYHDSTWHYIGTIWMLYRRSFYGGREPYLDEPWEAVWLPGATQPWLQPGAWDSTRMNQGRVFSMIWTQTDPIPIHHPPYSYLYAAPSDYQTEVLGWVHMDDGTYVEIHGPINVGVLDDPVVSDGLILRLQITRIHEWYMWNNAQYGGPIGIGFGGFYEYEGQE